MKDGPLARIERELLGWLGVWKKRDEDGPGGTGVTGYRYGNPETGGPQIGHIHDDGHADFRFPKEVRDRLIRSGKATAHPAFPSSRTTASYRVRGEEDVPGALQLFKINYERLKEAAERKAERGADGREKTRKRPVLAPASVPARALARCSTATFEFPRRPLLRSSMNTRW